MSRVCVCVHFVWLRFGLELEFEFGFGLHLVQFGLVRCVTINELWCTTVWFDIFLVLVRVSGFSIQQIGPSAFDYFILLIWNQETMKCKDNQFIFVRDAIPYISDKTRYAHGISLNSAVNYNNGCAFVGVGLFGCCCSYFVIIILLSSQSFGTQIL